MRKLIIPVLFLALKINSAALSVEGSSTILPLAQYTAEVYMDAHPTADISIKGGGSGVGITSLIEKRTDIANSSRHIKPEEISKAKAKGINPVAHIVAIDTIVLIVNINNGINNLTQEQVRAIYTGKITNWKEVGGADLPITIVSRDSASGTFEAFNEIALKKDKLAETERSIMQASNQGVAGVVSYAKGAIGYIGLGYLRQNKKIKAITVDNIMPSVKTALDKTYPYSRELYMYTDGQPSALAQSYLNFVKSVDGQKISAELGFVPLTQAE